VYIPPEETMTTRAGALAASNGNQQVRQQERSEHVRRQRELVAVRGDRPLGREHARVVDQHVEARLSGGEARRERPHVAQVAHVA
jgi:hypothetical protein